MLEISTVFRERKGKHYAQAFSDLDKAKAYARQTQLTGYIAHRANGKYTAYVYKNGRIKLPERVLVQEKAARDCNHKAAYKK